MKTLLSFFVFVLFSVVLVFPQGDTPPKYLSESELTQEKEKSIEVKKDQQNQQKEENLADDKKERKKDFPDLKIGASPEDVYRQLLPGEIAFKSSQKILVQTRDSLMHMTTGYLMPGEIMITDTATYASGKIRKFDIAQCGNLTYPVRRDGTSITELDVKSLIPFAVYAVKEKDNAGKIIEVIKMIPDSMFQNNVLSRLERIENLLVGMKHEETFWDTAWPWIIGGAIVVGTTTTYALSRKEGDVTNIYPPKEEGGPGGPPPNGKPVWRIGFSFSLH